MIRDGGEQYWTVRLAACYPFARLANRTPRAAAATSGTRTFALIPGFANQDIGIHLSDVVQPSTLRWRRGAKGNSPAGEPRGSWCKSPWRPVTLQRHGGHRRSPSARVRRLFPLIDRNGPVDLVLVSLWFSHLEARSKISGLAHLLHRLGSFSRVISFDKYGIGLSDPAPPGAMPPLECGWTMSEP